jgi:transcriptional regulator of arginine metabolism
MSNYSGDTGAISKTVRQATLLEIVRSHTVTTQKKLCELLALSGVSSTQMSASRDIRELGLVKRNGQYVVPTGGESPTLDTLAHAVCGFIEQLEIVGDNLLIVKTLPGTAHSVALLLDSAPWEGIKGTIAGDDTIFVAVIDKKAGKDVKHKLRKLIKE